MLLNCRHGKWNNSKFITIIIGCASKQNSSSFCLYNLFLMLMKWHDDHITHISNVFCEIHYHFITICVRDNLHQIDNKIGSIYLRLISFKKIFRWKDIRDVSKYITSFRPQLWLTSQQLINSNIYRTLYETEYHTNNLSGCR